MGHSHKYTCTHTQNVFFFCFMWEKYTYFMLRLTTHIFLCTWSTCVFSVNVDAGVYTHSHRSVLFV